MAKKSSSNFGMVFLLLVVLLVPCSIDIVLASPQELFQSTELRRKMAVVCSSQSGRAHTNISPSSAPESSPLSLSSGLLSSQSSLLSAAPSPFIEYFLKTWCPQNHHHHKHHH